MCVRRPPICPSRYLLLNHLAEFYQTCYITSPHGKGVREQHYFSVRPSFVHLSVTLSPPRPLGGIQPNLLERHYFSVRQSVRPASVHLSVKLSSKPLGGNYQTCCMISPHGKGVGEQVRPSVMLLATLANSAGICDGMPTTLFLVLLKFQRVRFTAFECV